MQVHDSYLVVETEEGLQVVDQHALHERILYEQIRQRILKGSVESQRLLIPEPVEVTATEAELLRGHAPVLRQLGLSVEEFGGNTVVVTAYPVLLRRVSPPQILREVLDELLAEGRGPTRRDLLDKLMHMMSCKAAVKAGMRLAPEEIESLLAWRHLVDDAHHCPHGRPTALNLSRAELDRQFGRLG
jgi:DNA mismatch repair protein MutL